MHTQIKDTVSNSILSDTEKLELLELAQEK